MDNKQQTVNIIGAGLAGLSAALALAEKKICSRLISVQASERAQSNLAEGGINAALDVMGEKDTVSEHARDTENGGCHLADPAMIRDLTEAAPGIVQSLIELGVPFHRENGHIIQRNFGGQKKKRTAYAKSSTGKVIMAALIDAVRRQESAGLVTRYPHHRFEKLILKNGNCAGVQVYDLYRKRTLCLEGMTIIACGGFNGMFGGATTGTTANTGSCAAELFGQGVRFANLEFLQYHPTTTAITGKRMLISEAARGEGGRLFCYKDSGDEQADKKCYFMEEAYGERGNLMPRDVISREMARLGRQVYLDLSEIPDKVWEDRLSDLREEIIHYLGTDPAHLPVPVSPGIHFCMGGVYVDAGHRTSIRYLYAAGECAAAYHGANRLGGNSLLGAIYGGRKAAFSAALELNTEGGENAVLPPVSGMLKPESTPFSFMSEREKGTESEMEKALLDGMGILRSGERIEEAIERVKALCSAAESDEMTARLLFAMAILKAAEARQESRGAHTRVDYPETSGEYRKTTVVSLENDRILVEFEPIQETKRV